MLPYWELRSCGAAETGIGIRHGYIASMLLACIPPLWRRYMAPALAHWDAELASDDERRLLHAAGHPSPDAAHPKGVTP